MIKQLLEKYNPIITRAMIVDYDLHVIEEFVDYGVEYQLLFLSNEDRYAQLEFESQSIKCNIEAWYVTLGSEGKDQTIDCYGRDEYNFLLIGKNALEVLKGSSETLKHITYISCSDSPEVSSFLSEFGFEKVENNFYMKIE